MFGSEDTLKRHPFCSMVSFVVTSVRDASLHFMFWESKQGNIAVIIWQKMLIDLKWFSRFKYDIDIHIFKQVSTVVAWNAQCMVKSPFFLSAKIHTPIIWVTFFWASLCTLISEGKWVSTAHFCRNLKLFLVLTMNLLWCTYKIVHKINSDL